MDQFYDATIISLSMQREFRDPYKSRNNFLRQIMHARENLCDSTGSRP